VLLDRFSDARVAGIKLQAVRAELLASEIVARALPPPEPNCQSPTMLHLKPKADPTRDKAAPAVLAAYRAAVASGRPTPECYRAGVEVWQRYHPDHTRAYAAAQAVEAIQRATVSLRIEA
jgi:hypothetical protein